MTQSARTTFWEEIKRDWNCGMSTSKTQLWLWTKRGESESRLASGSGPSAELVFNGLWPRGLRHGAKDVGRCCLALFGSLGQCAFAYSIHALECPKEEGDRKASSSFSF